MKEVQQTLIRFEGKVQGVGFRYTTWQLLSTLPITGYVKNLPDGSVELLLQGNPSSIEAARTIIRDRFKSNIEKESQKQGNETKIYASFEIAR